MCIISAIAGTTLATSIATALGTSATAAAWGILGTGITVASGIGGTIAGAVGQYQQGKGQQAMYNYQAQIDRGNAEIAKKNAAQERQAGLEESRLQRMKTISAIGQQQASLAANNIDVSEGTALDVISDTAMFGELDALTTQANYEKKALAYEQQANNFNNQSNLDIIAGQNAKTSGMWNAIGTTIEGTGKALSTASGLGGFGRVSPRWGGFGGGSAKNV